MSAEAWQVVGLIAIVVLLIGLALLAKKGNPTW